MLQGSTVGGACCCSGFVLTIVMRLESFVELLTDQDGEVDGCPSELFSSLMPLVWLSCTTFSVFLNLDLRF